MKKCILISTDGLSGCQPNQAGASDTFVVSLIQAVHAKNMPRRRRRLEKLIKVRKLKRVWAYNPHGLKGSINQQLPRAMAIHRYYTPFHGRQIEPAAAATGRFFFQSSIRTTEQTDRQTGQLWAQQL